MREMREHGASFCSPVRVPLAMWVRATPERRLVALPGINNLRVVNTLNSSTPAASTTSFYYQ